MDSLTELMHTFLGVFGCGCLDDDFWRSRRRSSGRSAPPEPPLLHPRPQAGSMRGDDLLEELLRSPMRTPPPEGSRDSLDESGLHGQTQQLQRGLSSSSDEMCRAGSVSTKVGVLRSQSPFYQAQHPQQQQQQAAAAGIELKPAPPNVLLGQQHLEGRGRFVAAHPVAVRRGPSPLHQQQQQQQQQQQHAAGADEG